MPRSVNQLPPQSNVEAYQRIEAILESGPFVCGTRAVHRAYFLYSLRWSQAGARICEMNKVGWQIVSITLSESEWKNGIRTAYRLDSKPLRPQCSCDWYEGQQSRRRPTAADNLPLFAAVRS